jgi:hypothetical protein
MKSKNLTPLAVMLTVLALIGCTNGVASVSTEVPVSESIISSASDAETETAEVETTADTEAEVDEETEAKLGETYDFTIPVDIEKTVRTGPMLGYYDELLGGFNVTGRIPDDCGLAVVEKEGVEGVYVTHSNTLVVSGENAKPGDTVTVEVIEWEDRVPEAFRNNQ